MEALKNNDAPATDSGIATAFAFASPMNKSQTGPLGRFVQMVHNPMYAVMLNCRSIEYSELRVRDDQAEQVVKLIDADGDPAIFIFHLSRQTGGSLRWMLDDRWGDARFARGDTAR